MGEQAVPSGDAFSVAIIWSAASVPESDYAIRWRLLGAADTVAQKTLPLSSYATSNWRQDDSFEAHYKLRIDPAVPAGNYALAFNVIDPDGNSLWAEDEAISTLEVLHRDRQFDLPDDIGHPLDLTLGGVIHLRGFDLGATEGAPGDVLPLTLTWQTSGVSGPGSRADPIGPGDERRCCRNHGWMARTASGWLVSSPPKRLEPTGRRPRGFHNPRATPESGGRKHVPRTSRPPAARAGWRHRR